MLTVWAFDCDETLEVGRPPGPIKIIEMLNLKMSGDVVGLMGNWVQFIKAVGSHYGDYVDFIGPVRGVNHDKRPYLEAIRNGIPADDYVLVGNVGGVSGSSDEDIVAKDTGWRFIKEDEFAEGKR